MTSVWLHERSWEGVQENLKTNDTIIIPIGSVESHGVHSPLCTDACSALGIAVLGALFQGFARKTYFSHLTELGLDQATIQKSVEVLTAWLKTNSGDVAAQFGITVQQLEGVISHYQGAYTTGVSQVLWIGAAVIAVGAVLAWFTFRNRTQS